MAKEIRSFKNLLGKLDGISDAQLEAHFGLYEGYVKKLNEIEEKLAKTDRGLSNYSFGEYAELKRRYSVPYNGTYLHEMYFDNLGQGGNAGTAFEKLVNETYGSMDAWKADVKATGLAVPGWVITCLDTHTGKLCNLQIMEHHIGFTLNMVPLMVMDTWEHAFFLDYKANRGAYIDTFFKNINWSVVNDRTTKALASR
jgi:superoxide dismutase, Fe-Mn family